MRRPDFVHGAGFVLLLTAVIVMTSGCSSQAIVIGNITSMVATLFLFVSTLNLTKHM